MVSFIACHRVRLNLKVLFDGGISTQPLRKEAALKQSLLCFTLIILQLLIFSGHKKIQYLIAMQAARSFVLKKKNILLKKLRLSKINAPNKPESESSL